MKYLSQIFLAGLAAVVPLALTVALLVWLGVQSERLLGGAVRWLLPDALVFPGLGLILGIVLVFGVGLLMQIWLVQRLFAVGEALLERIPLIKTVYGSIRDVMHMFSRRDGEETGKPVVVHLAGRDEALLGLVTRDGLEEDMGGADIVAVYLPMSYQIGGYTLLLPRDQVSPLDMGAQEAMRFVLTAGMGLGKSEVAAPAKSTHGKSEVAASAGSTHGKTAVDAPANSTHGLGKRDVAAPAKSTGPGKRDVVAPAKPKGEKGRAGDKQPGGGSEDPGRGPKS